MNEFDKRYSAAMSTFQRPVHHLCKHTSATIKKCITYNMYNFPNKELVKIEHEALQKAREVYNRIINEGTDYYFVSIVAPYFYKLMSILQRTGHSAANKPFLRQFMLDELLNSEAIEDKTEVCFCTNFSFKPEKWQFQGNTNNQATNELSEDPPQNNESNISVSKSEGRIEPPKTEIYIEGSPIPLGFGSVIIGGEILDISTPRVKRYVNMDIKIDKAIFTGEVENSNSYSINLFERFDYFVDMLIGLGQFEYPIKIENITIDDIPVPASKYKISKGLPIKLLHEDLTDYKKTPGYKDYYVLYLYDIKWPENGKIRVRVHEERPEFTFDDTIIIPSDSAFTFIDTPQISSDYNTLYFIDKAANKIHLIDKDYPYKEAKFTIPIPQNVGVWFIEDNGSLYYQDTIDFNIKKYDPVTNTITNRYNSNATSRFIYRTDGILCFEESPNTCIFTSTLGTFKHTLNLSSPRLFERSAVIDIIDIGTRNLYRFEKADLSTAVKLTLPVAPQNVISYDNGYVLFTTTKIYVITTNNVLLHVLDAPDDFISLNFIQKRWLIDDYIYFTKNKTLYALDTTLGEIHAFSLPSAYTNPGFQITIGSLLTTFNSYIVKIKQNYSSNGAIKIKTILDKLGYNNNINDNYECVGLFTSSPEEDCTTILQFCSYPSDITIYSGVNLDTNTSTIENEIKEALENDLTLNYKSIDYEQETYHYSKGFESNKTDYNTNLFLEADEAHIILSNLYAYNKTSKDTISIETRNFELNINTIVNINNSNYIITHWEITNTIIKAVGEKIPLNFDTTVPALPQPATQPPILPKWSSPTTKFIVVPIVLDNEKPHTIGVIGNLPDSLCVNEKCVDSLPKTPITIWGELVAPYPCYSSHSESLDTETEIYIKFVAPPGALLNTATYDELLSDPYKNLFFVGNEAIQYMNYEIQSDNVTVKFYNLIRGCLNTGFFVNFHAPNEKCYIYNPNTFVSVNSETKWFVVSDKGSNSITVRNHIADYLSPIRVYETWIDEENTFHMSFVDDPSDCLLLLSTKPIIFGQYGNEGIFGVYLINDGVREQTLQLDVPNTNTIYWMVHSVKGLPEYGVIMLPKKHLSKAKKITGYCLIGV